MSRDVVIDSACRTPIGAFGGSLKSVDAPNLAAIAIKEAIERAKIDPAIIQDIRLGCCVEPVDSLNIARVAALLAGVPDTVPAATCSTRSTVSSKKALSWLITITVSPDSRR